ncbi:hypothetical protein ACSBR1_024743 [Camellia fascicularis]
MSQIQEYKMQHMYIHHYWIPLYGKAPNCNYSTASAYNLVADQETNEPDWSWVWKVKVPQKLKGFLWLVLKGRLPTNHMRLDIVRNIANSGVCPRCNSHVEDVDHLIRGCFKAQDTWVVRSNQW